MRPVEVDDALQAPEESPEPGSEESDNLQLSSDSLLNMNVESVRSNTHASYQGIG